MNASQPSAFEKLISSHEKWLHAYVERVVNDRHAAEDIVQETFLRAWLHADRLRMSGSVHGWLRVVARNLLIDRIRMPVTHHEFAGTDGLELTQDDHADTVHYRMEVTRLLRNVSEEHRAVLLHRYLYGRSVQETARALGVPEGTVKSRQHYALESLRRTSGEFTL
ncbi:MULTISPECIES: sigma-70 family RNA polymerase sigma factor [Streptomyces]|uniref:RNA polymerase n=1 Tax=Streptomyces cadmiisoli TaxID=2184053 RepID=A0A2Z4ISP7_9ACTN|nr:MULTISPECIES: sigma-70 family RNA polymerase sigma factor [Streptomyces]AWW35865.1 RNA polymerase [Streptomyces cadmiisoli]KOV51762.1 hypothetical protein ADL00_39940 [Streptomyces sp. AS58]